MLQTTFITEFRYGPIPIGFLIKLEGKYIVWFANLFVLTGHFMALTQLWG